MSGARSTEVQEEAVAAPGSPDGPPPVSIRQAKRWTAMFFATLLIVSGAAAVLNLAVNPFGYYPTNLFPPLTWSSRQIKVDLLRRRGNSEILVLGSSRAMKVAPSHIHALTGLRAFNACVDSARAEDWLALYAFARGEQREALRELVIGIDLEAFHNHLEPDARLAGLPELRQSLPLGMQLRLLTQASPLSYGQAVASLRSLQLSRTGYPPQASRFDEDGFLHYVFWEREIAEGSFSPALSGPYAEYEGRFAGFTALDEQRTALFEELLARAHRDRVRVRAFITPLYSGLVANLRRSHDFDGLRALMLGYLESVAGRFQEFSYVDFTDVHAFGGDPNGFLDPAHTDDANSRRMTEALWRR